MIIKHILEHHNAIHKTRQECYRDIKHVFVLFAPVTITPEQTGAA